MDILTQYAYIMSAATVHLWLEATEFTGNGASR